MKVLSFIPKATHFGFHGEDVYWIESDQEQFAGLVYPLLNDYEREKLDRTDRRYIADRKGRQSSQGHINFLANSDWSRFVIETWSMPHSGMWNAYSPFRQISPFTFQTLEEFHNKIFVGPESTNLVCFSALLPERFTDEFSQIRAILERNGIVYRLLNGTKDIWCRDYMPVQISAKDFVQFRYEPSYLITDEDLLTRSDPWLVNSENGLNPANSEINLDGGNVVRYKEKAMITARVFRENQNLALTREELREKLSHDLKAHVIIIPEHPGDVIDHADGNVRFLDHQTVLINELKPEYKYWKEGIAKITEDYGFRFIEVPWFTPRYKKDSLSAIGIYINYLEVGNLIILPKFEIEGNRDQEALDLFRKLFPGRIVEQVNINAIAEEGGLLNCITWNIKIAK